MNNYITKKYAIANSPCVSKSWSEKSNKERIQIVYSKLRESNEYEDFIVVDANNLGQVTLKINKNIPANIRGPLLLDLEQKLKNSLEKSITVWLVSTADKSKLRQLRGVNVQSIKQIDY